VKKMTRKELHKFLLGASAASVAMVLTGCASGGGGGKKRGDDDDDDDDD
jgi:hypothetical protein